MSQSEHKEKGKKTTKLLQSSAKVLGYGAISIFLLVWVFVLGVLTGRGDIHRWLQRLGLYKTEVAVRLGVTPANPEAAVQPVLPTAEGPKIEAEPAKPTAAESQPPTSPVAVAPPPDKGTVKAAAVPAVEPAKKTEAQARSEVKKGKGAGAAKTEAHDSIAARLNFQNSLDSPARKPAKATAQKEKTVHTAAMTPGTATPAAAADKKKPASTYQIRVASYRTAGEAQKAAADLAKKGIKVNIQQGKDNNGPTFIIHTQRYQSKAEAEKVAKQLRDNKMGGQIQELKP